MKRIPQIISIVGRSGVGKTTLLEKVIRQLTRRGYRIATIKHYNHGFEIDHPGKDSYRHSAAGSNTAVVLGPDKMAIVRKLDKPLSFKAALELAFPPRSRQSIDLIITEGFKREKMPKLEVVRKAISRRPVSSPSRGLVALITDVVMASNQVPVFGLDDIKKITDFIEKRFL
ncbi:MAG: molybdopterin-guanine dinucleotide biosynthesis protein B [Candidatus Brocadiia bacterium]